MNEHQTVTSKYLRRSKLSPSQLLCKPLFEIKGPRPKKPPPPVDLTTKPRRPLSRNDRRRIIYSRFGSETDFSHHRMTCLEISRKLLIPLSTVGFTLVQFERRGRRLDAFERPLDNRFRNIPEPVRQQLVARELLQEWAPFNLRERVAIIERVYAVKISTFTLHKFYRANDIRFKAKQQVYKSALLNKPYLQHKRREFAVLLGNLMNKKTHLIFVDESAFNS